MSTQHRPGKEPDKQAKPLLELFYASVKNGNVKRATQLLGQVNKHPPHGLWMHRALGLAIEGNTQWRHAMVDMLLGSPHPPQPTEKSDFIKLAMAQGDMDLAYTLLEQGFRAHPNTVNRMLEQIAWNPKADTSRMKAPYLVGARKEQLVESCAAAVVNNAPEYWVRMLNACLPQPLPAQQITERLMGKMAQMGSRMEDIERSSLNLARDLWWTDANMAKLHYDKLDHARHYTGKPLYTEDSLRNCAQALSMIERSGIEEELVAVANSAPAAPRKRL